MQKQPGRLVTSMCFVDLSKKLRLSVTEQTFKLNTTQKTTSQGSESAESHSFLIGVAYLFFFFLFFFTNYNYIWILNWIRHFSIRGAQTELVTCRGKLQRGNTMDIYWHPWIPEVFGHTVTPTCDAVFLRNAATVWKADWIQWSRSMAYRQLWIKLKYFSKFGGDGSPHAEKCTNGCS